MLILRTLNTDPGYQFTPISLAVGRRLRKLKGIVMLIKNTAEHLNSPYFYWKLPADVTREEVLYSADLFCPEEIALPAAWILFFAFRLVRHPLSTARKLCIVIGVCSSSDPFLSNIEGWCLALRGRTTALTLD